MTDRGVEFFDVKANKTVVLLVFNGFKLLDHGCCVFPLVEFGCSRDFAVDSVEDCLADSAYLGFGGEIHPLMNRQPRNRPVGMNL